MSDATETTGPTDSPVRSTPAVLLMLAGLVAIPFLVLLAVVFLRGAGSSGTGEQIADSVREDRIQAVYMANDEVFFGRIRNGEGDVFELQDAFFLRRTPEGDKNAEESLNLVSVAQDVGGDGDLVVNANEVIRVQNLNTDAEIATSIQDATE